MIWFILILGTVLRLINLNQGLWLDEAAQVLLSNRSITDIIFNSSVDVHPPLSYILMHFWMIANTSDVWLRMLSVLFGVLTIWTIFILASKLIDKKVGLLSAFLLSISPFHIYYSQEVRMYSEAIFFAVVSMYYFFLSTKKNNLLHSIIYILATTVLIYTHYAGFLLLFTQIIYHLFFRLGMRSLLKKMLVVILLWLPWLPQFVLQLSRNINADNYLPGWGEILKVPLVKVIPLIFFKFSFGRVSFDNKLLYFSIASLILFIFGLILYLGIKAAKTTDSKLVIFWLLIPIIIAVIVSFVIPFDQPHRLIFVLPSYCILLSMGISKMKRFQKLSLFVLTLISFLGLGMYYFIPKYWREDWKGAANFISTKSTQNSLSVFAWPKPFPPFEWYGKSLPGKGVAFKFPASREEVGRNLQNINANELFVFEYLQPLSDPSHMVQTIVEEKGFKNDVVYDFRGVGFIYHYTK
jgi:mannosyltransferase